MFWTPLSRARYSLDWVFILDPVFTGIVLATPRPRARLPRARQRRIAAAGAGLLARLHRASAPSLHARALATWKRMDAPPPGATVAVLPQFLSPFRWLGLSERGARSTWRSSTSARSPRGVADPKPPKKWSEILASLRDFYPPPERAKIRSFERPPASPVLEAARALPDIGVYLAFARFPLETVYPTRDGGAEVVVQDLRFLPWFTGPWERGGEEGIRRQPFVYRVRFDAALRAVERGFVRSGRR